MNKQQAAQLCEYARFVFEDLGWDQSTESFTGFGRNCCYVGALIIGEAVKSGEVPAKRNKRKLDNLNWMDKLQTLHDKYGLEGGIRNMIYRLNDGDSLTWEEINKKLMEIAQDE